jgi:hypothetical protein
MSDPTLQRAAQPPGESAAGDGIEGKVFYEECLLCLSVELVIGICFERAIWLRQRLSMENLCAP